MMLRTNTPAGTERGPDRSTNSPSSPDLAARHIAARSSAGERAVEGSPAIKRESSRATMTRNSPAISTTESTAGQASQMRSSMVGTCAEGRTSK
jgi:hypothetical protein